MSTPWSTPDKPHPLVVLPQHLSRMQDRLHAAFTAETTLAAASFAVTIPREDADAIHSYGDFLARAPPALTTAWGTGVSPSAVHIHSTPPA